MDPNYFQPILVYLDQQNALALLYFGEVDGRKIELAIDRDRVALSVDASDRSVVMGYHIADRTLFVNRRRSGPDGLSAFQQWVDQVQCWGQDGNLAIQLIPKNGAM